MPGRKFNGGEYRYGFNGMENDNEIKGEGNSVDFGARMYDPRLGRWQALDPLAAKYPSMSPYNFVGNSPIMFIDPDGRKIINADKILLNNFKARLKLANEKFNQWLVDNGDFTRKTFTGTKEEWKEYKSARHFASTSIRLNKKRIKEYTILSQRTDDLMTKWKKRSPNIYNKIDQMEVDMMLGSQDLTQIGKGVKGGSNDVTSRYKKNLDGTYSVRENPRARLYDGYSANSMDVYITTSDEDIGYLEGKGKRVMNHEAGHFYAIIMFAQEYAEYLKHLDEDGRKLNGGHNPDDISGQQAEKWENIDDIK